MRRVALLRGVNVGGKAKVAMPALKKVFEDLGARDVDTYIQSGNVIFNAPATLNAKKLETAIEKHFHLKVDVTLRTHAQLKALVEENPYDDEVVHVGFLFAKPKKADLARVDAAKYEPEGFMVRGDDVYLHLPFGVGGSKGFMPHFTKRVGVPMTVRNWNTVKKLRDLSS
jgi:uncharacterized protein (DUF1697 family)